jgi:hypothetical protein
MAAGHRKSPSSSFKWNHRSPAPEAMIRHSESDWKGSGGTKPLRRGRADYIPMLAPRVPAARRLRRQRPSREVKLVAVRATTGEPRAAARRAPATRPRPGSSHQDATRPEPEADERHGPEPRQRRTPDRSSAPGGAGTRRAPRPRPAHETMVRKPTAVPSCRPRPALAPVLHAPAGQQRAELTAADRGAGGWLVASDRLPP